MQRNLVKPPKNKESTRAYSDAQEKSVCKALGALQQPSSGSGHFRKGDVCTRSFLIECKCAMSSKDSFSIRKDWIDKNGDEAFSIRKPNTAIAFNFGPDSPNYYVINERLMRFLVETLESDKD